MAFIMHSLHWLAANGTAAIVCFPGIMYRSGTEKKIRKYLVDNGFVDAVIQLASNFFFGTSIATCIMVLKKGKSDNTLLFIDSFPDIKIVNACVHNLTWTHFRSLLRVDDKAARLWYMKEAANEGWSYRTLDKNIGTQYYYRLLQSPQKEKVIAEMQAKTALHTIWLFLNFDNISASRKFFAFTIDTVSKKCYITIIDTVSNKIAAFEAIKK